MSSSSSSRAPSIPVHVVPDEDDEVVWYSSSSDEDSDSINCSDGNKHLASDSDSIDTEELLYSSEDDMYTRLPPANDSPLGPLSVYEQVKTNVESEIFTFSRQSFMGFSFDNEKAFLDHFIPAIEYLGYRIANTSLLTARGLYSNDIYTLTVYQIELDLPIKWYNSD